MRNGLMNSVVTCINTPWSQNEVTCEHYGKFEADTDTFMTALKFIIDWMIYVNTYYHTFRYGRYHSHLMLFWLINKLRGFYIRLPRYYWFALNQNYYKSVGKDCQFQSDW